ncbi:hypothetical protein JG645_19230, partial [Vibrio cholerae]|uniref:hypothetical protein n=1 Tax=Vibrio cholerae TaxID=666 RepID=UPI0018F08ECA
TVGQVLEFHEGVAGREMLRTWKSEGGWPRTACNQDMTASASVFTHRDATGAGEAGKAMKRINALLGEMLLAPARHRIS